jgi:hypothetical protein
MSGNVSRRGWFARVAALCGGLLCSWSRSAGASGASAPAPTVTTWSDINQPGVTYTFIYDLEGELLATNAPGYPRTSYFRRADGSPS